MRNQRLAVCRSCGGFVPGHALSCPHCRASRTSVRGPLAMLGGGAIAFTLMACYGAPPCDDGTDMCPRADAGALDASEGGDASTDANRPDVQVTKDSGSSTGDAGADASEDAPDGD